VEAKYGAIEEAVVVTGIYKYSNMCGNNSSGKRTNSGNNNSNCNRYIQIHNRWSSMRRGGIINRGKSNSGSNSNRNRYIKSSIGAVTGTGAETTAAARAVAQSAPAV
jgi:hypothetical protein